MNEIKISVEDKNLETVLTVLNSFNDGLISEIKTSPKETVRACDVSNNTKETENYYTPASTLDRIDIDEKRKKLFSFAFITLILLAAYWSYSFAGVIVSKRGSDYWVSKLYFNVSK
jgi:hypothetical protein